MKTFYKDCGNCNNTSFENPCPVERDCEPPDYKDWTPRDFELVVNPGKILIGKRRSNVFCKIKIKDGELTISGVEGPLQSGNCRGSCGQCYPIKLDWETLKPGWTIRKLNKFNAVWDRWHLNHMRAYCEHQRELYGKKELKYKQWVYETEHPEGILCKPCPICGYRYGTSWMKEELPFEVYEFLVGLPETTVIPAWV